MVYRTQEQIKKQTRKDVNAWAIFPIINLLFLIGIFERKENDWRIILIPLKEISALIDEIDKGDIDLEIIFIPFVISKNPAVIPLEIKSDPVKSFKGVEIKEIMLRSEKRSITSEKIAI